MAKKLVAWGRIKGGQKEVHFDRSEFSDDAAITKHLTERETDLLAMHLIACKNGDDKLRLPDSVAKGYFKHNVVDCRLCRSKLQALMIVHDENGPEDRSPDMYNAEVDRLHVSAPPDRELEGVYGMHIIPEPDLLFLKD